MYSTYPYFFLLFSKSVKKSDEFKSTPAKNVQPTETVDSPVKVLINVAVLLR